MAAPPYWQPVSERFYTHVWELRAEEDPAQRFLTFSSWVGGLLDGKCPCALLWVAGCVHHETAGLLWDGPASGLPYCQGLLVQHTALKEEAAPTH